MREIKFRGKSIKEKEWKYGSLIIEDEITGIGTLDYDDEYRFRRYYIRNGTQKQGGEVDERTIGQYTGLKDKNGIKIYEGDILKMPEWLLNNNENEKCVCIYNEEHQCNEIIGFGLYMKESYSGEYRDLIPSDEWDEFEVIGNIYDNPELLEEEV